MDIAFLPPDHGATGRWVVVADGARARLFETHHHAPGLRSVLPFDLTTNRLRDHQRWSDRAGQTRERHGHSMHSMAAATDPSEHEQDAFAQQLAKILRKARVEHRLDSIVLVVAPGFLGRLRAALDEPTCGKVIATDERDLSRLPAHELEARIPAAAWPTGAPPPRRYAVS